MKINLIVNILLLLDITKYPSQFACSRKSPETSPFNDCHSYIVIALFIYRKEKIDVH